MKVIDITESSSIKSNIEIIKKSDIQVAMLDVNDLDQFKETDLCNKNAIYLLLNESEIYIGQTDRIYERLKNHSRLSSFNRVTLFTSRDGVIEKGMLNYIEFKLIKKYRKNADKKVENDNKGQETSILFENKIKADNLIKSFDEIVDMFSIDLLKNEMEALEDESESAEDFTIQFEGQKFDLDKGKQIDVFLGFIDKIFEKNSQFILDQIREDAPSFSDIFGKKERFSRGGYKSSIKRRLGEHEIHIWSGLSKKNKLLKMEKLKTELEEYERKMCNESVN
ncbi:MAG: hypothetical protein FWG67_02125 [Defluviitaleaceae bacterium]|nr:hypothetical protein [Defluviitaleaceae bacterium]